MISCFDEKKATEMAAYLLAKSGGGMNYTKLIKLLYMADREALKRWGYPLTGDSYFSLKDGPITSGIRDLIKGRAGMGFWHDHIQTRGYNVHLVRDTDGGNLSEAAIELLDELFAKYKDTSWSQLRNLTHKLFPEWQNPGSGRIPISYHDILTAVGREEEATEIAEEIESRNQFIQDLLDCS